MITVLKTFFRILALCSATLLLALVYPRAEQAARQPTGSTDRFEINLYTFSPHQSLFAWYGHSAIEVRNLKTGQAHMFNFGGFFFDTEHFIEYGLGKFQFWTFVQESKQALRPYQKENRHIVVQTLNLTPQQKNKIRKRLIDSLKPENRVYTYNHFLDNCSTRIRDVIDDALNGELRQQSLDISDLTYRDHIHRLMAVTPIVDFSLLFVLNDFVDQPISYWESMFLPDRLMAVVETAYNPQMAGEGQQLLVKNRSDDTIETAPPYFMQKVSKANTSKREAVFGVFLMLMLAISGIVHLRRRSPWKRIYPFLVSAFGLIFGTMGTILFIMMVFTQHRDTYWNENILLLNPVTFLLFPLGLAMLPGKGKKAFAFISLFCGTVALSAFCVKLLPMFDQANGQQLRVLLPSLLIMGLIGALDLRKSDKGK